MWRRDRHGVALDHRRSVASRSAVFVALAMGALGAPAAAQSAGASLSVGATVLPTCLVSTETGSRSGPGAAVSCENFGDGSIAIERDSLPSSRSAEPVESAPNSDSSPPEGVSYITISY